MPKSQGYDSPESVERRKEMGRRIAAAQRKLRLKGHELAAKLNVSAGTLSGWKNGRYSPTNENLAALATLSGESTSYFNPERLPDRDGIEWLGKRFATLVGERRLRAPRDPRRSTRA